MWQGQPSQPNPSMWPGQSNPGQHPAWPGQSNLPQHPGWPGQSNPPQQPGWPGQSNPPQHPAWPGQSNTGPHPAWPAHPNQPSKTPAQNHPTAPPKTLLPMPYELKLPNGVYDKMLITIQGKILTNAKGFVVNLSRGKDIALHLNPRFNEKAIVRNTQQKGRWGKEERALSHFPFGLGQDFELKILCSPTEYRVAVNKAHLLEYKHRIPELSQITTLTICKDIQLTSVNVEKLP